MLELVAITRDPNEKSSLCSMAATIDNRDLINVALISTPGIFQEQK